MLNSTANTLNLSHLWSVSKDSQLASNYARHVGGHKELPLHLQKQDHKYVRSAMLSLSAKCCENINNCENKLTAFITFGQGGTQIRVGAKMRVSCLL